MGILPPHLKSPEKTNMEGFKDLRGLSAEEMGLEPRRVDNCEWCKLEDCLYYTEGGDGCLQCCKRELFSKQIDNYTSKFCEWYYNHKSCACGSRDSVFKNTQGLVDGLCYNCAVDKLCSPPVKSAAFLAAKQ